MLSQIAAVGKGHLASWIDVTVSLPYWQVGNLYFLHSEDSEVTTWWGSRAEARSSNGYYMYVRVCHEEFSPYLGDDRVAYQYDFNVLCPYKSVLGLGH